MVETGQTEVPVGRREGVGTTEDLFEHEELCTVEDNSGNVADDEDHNNTDEDRGQVELPTDRPVGGLLVRVSKEEQSGG